ncbi:MAG TPA: ATP-binding protein [Candidatus Sulfomarinibacteraceae bacterium]|nr:ATP-binding protein [Candidatus Sulfomarinibacteraceae bacterium]
MRRPSFIGSVQLAVAVGAAVGLSTGVVALLEAWLGVPNASNVYLVAVAAIAFRSGVAGASITALVSVLVYDVFFTEPRFALTVSDPDEWLHLVLLLFVAVTVGQLASLQRSRAEAALARAHESRALFDVTRSLATRSSTLEILPAIATALAREAGMDLVWFALGADDAGERVAGQSAAGPVPSPARGYAVLHRDAAGGAAAWTQVRGPTPGRQTGPASVRLVRVRMEQAGRPIGSLWAARGVGAGLPDSPTTTLLRVAADLVAQALAHDFVEAETRRAEVAQQSDALKSSLLESVSHDLRTPLASIRASAGTLMDPDLALDPVEVRTSAASIDREAQRLNRLVGNLLDLGRIEGGVLRVAEDALDLEDVVARSISLVEGRAGLRRIEVAMADESAVHADPILLEEALVNLLDNAIRHTPPGSAIRISAGPGAGPGIARLTVEDSGPGVPDAALLRIFDRFYRSKDGARPSGPGMGIGLAVVRGFVEAMGGHVAARRSDLGGLAIDVDLRAAEIPVAAETGS